MIMTDLCNCCLASEQLHTAVCNVYRSIGRNKHAFAWWRRRVKTPLELGGKGGAIPEVMKISDQVSYTESWRWLLPNLKLVYTNSLIATSFVLILQMTWELESGQLRLLQHPAAGVNTQGRTQVGEASFHCPDSRGLRMRLIQRRKLLSNKLQLGWIEASLCHVTRMFITFKYQLNAGGLNFRLQPFWFLSGRLSLGFFP